MPEFASKVIKLSLSAIWDSSQGQVAGMQTQVPEPQLKPPPYLVALPPVIFPGHLSFLFSVWACPSTPWTSLSLSFANLSCSPDDNVATAWSRALLIKQVKCFPLNLLSGLFLALLYSTNFFFFLSLFCWVLEQREDRSMLKLTRQPKWYMLYQPYGIYTIAGSQSREFQVLGTLYKSVSSTQGKIYAPGKKQSHLFFFFFERPEVPGVINLCVPCALHVAELHKYLKVQTRATWK